MRSYNLKVGGQTFTAQILEYTETKVVVDLNGTTYEVELSSETTVTDPAARTQESPATPGPPPRRDRRPEAREPAPLTVPAEHSGTAPSRHDPHGAGAVIAPIPGVVKQIPVAVGDAVHDGSLVLVLEAMKMENEISARVSGAVSEILIDVGESVQEGQVLIQIEVS